MSAPPRRPFVKQPLTGSASLHSLHAPSVGITADVRKGAFLQPLCVLAPLLGLDPEHELEVVDGSGIAIFGKLHAGGKYYLSGTVACGRTQQPAGPREAVGGGGGPHTVKSPSQGFAAPQQLCNPDATMCVAYDKRMLLHVPPVDRTPETPYRLLRAIEGLQGFARAGQILPQELRAPETSDPNAAHSSVRRGQGVTYLQPRLATLEEVALCHDRELYRRFIEEGEDLSAAIKLKSDVYCCGKPSSVAARLAAAAAIDAAQLVFDSSMSCEPSSTTQADYGLCLIRPPGHHCGVREPGGFCLMNNVGIAVASLLRRGTSAAAQTRRPLSRVAIIDLDVHFGEGTVELFQDNRDVLYCSLHRFDEGKFYPFDPRGATSYVGPCRNVCNVAVDTHASDPKKCHEVISDFLLMKVVQDVFIPQLTRHRPELLVVSMGFDAAFGDPLGRMAVEGGFAAAIAALKQWCGAHLRRNPDGSASPSESVRERSSVPCGMVVALEGGYNPEAVARGVLGVACALRLPPEDADVAAFSVPQIPKTWGELRARQQRRLRQYEAMMQEQKSEEVAHVHVGKSTSMGPSEGGVTVPRPDLVEADDGVLLRSHLEWCDALISAAHAAHAHGLNA